MFDFIIFEFEFEGLSDFLGGILGYLYRPCKSKIQFAVILKRTLDGLLLIENIVVKKKN